MVEQYEEGIIVKFFKISPKVTEELKITEKNFDIAKNQNPNLYQGDICYGICPYCDNPVQLIGIIKEIKREPFGKHCKKDIDYVAKHDEESYEYCPYNSNRKSVTKDSRKKKVTERDIRIYNLIKEHFDQIIYIIRQDYDLYISNQKAQEILELAVKQEIWKYPGIDEGNIPWIMIYLGMENNIFGKLVKINSPLYQCLKEIGFVLEEAGNKYAKIGKQKKYFNYNYSFGFHERKVTEKGDLDEYVIAVLTEPDIYEYKELFRYKIEINHQRFHNLITSDKANQYRDKELLDIAEKIMR